MIGGFEKKLHAKVVRLPGIFRLEWSSIWLSDWAEIWCGKVSRLEERAHESSLNLHEQFGRCFTTGGVSGARRARIVGVWRAVALSEGTYLRHKDAGSCIFSEIWYGGSWGRMRNAHKIWGRSEVFWGVIGGFEENAKDWRLPAELPIGMIVDMVIRLG